MTAINWQNAVSGDWNDGSLWSTGTVPGSGDSAVVSVSGFYTISIAASIDVGTVALTDTDATLAISSPGQTNIVEGDFINLGTLDIDTNDNGGGSTLIVVGTLGNANIVQIGPGFGVFPGALTAPTMVTAGELANTGSIVLYGGQTNQATLNIESAAPTIINGYLALYNDSLLEFAGGEITSIAEGGEILLSGTNAEVADADNPSTSNALRGLASNAGIFDLQNGASVIIDGSFSNDGAMDIDSGVEEGGSALTIDGTLFNSGLLQIGSPAEDPSASTTVTVDDLTGVGMVQLFGGSGTDTNQAVLDIDDETAPGTLIFDLEVHGDSLVDFASGNISAIGDQGTLVLDGTDASIGAGNGNALNLANNAGDLELDNGASLVIGNGFTNDGDIKLDAMSQLEGGSSLAINGTLFNSGSLQIGSGEFPVASTTVTAEDLVSTGSIRLYGGTEGLSGGEDTSQAALDITTGTAPGTLTSDLELHGTALAEFATGEISAIGIAGTLVVDGTAAFVADAGSTNSNSALTALSSIAGMLELDDGAVVDAAGLTSNAGVLAIESGATLGASLTSNSGELELLNSVTLATPENFDNTGVVSIDTGYGGGGSVLTVNGTLTNSGTMQIGSLYNNPDAPTTVTAEDLISTGAVRLDGGTDGYTSQAALDITAGAAPGTLTSDLEVHGTALVEFASGEIDAIGIGGTLVVDGAAAFVADAGNTDSNSALNGLTSNAGVLEIENGASIDTNLVSSTGDLELHNNVTLMTPGDFDNTGAVNIDTGDDEGGSELTVNGTLSNSGAIQVGSLLNDLDAPITVTAKDLIGTGSIKLYGGIDGDTNQATVDITAGAAPGTLTSDLELHGSALAEFASGEIGMIGTGGVLIVDGTAAFVADAGSTDSNSALTALTVNAGVLEIENGASVHPSLASNTGELELQNQITLATPGDFDNTGAMNIDTDYGDGGSMLTVNGTLTNGGAIQIGSLANGSETPTSVIVEDLVSTGFISLYGGTLDPETGQVTLDVAEGSAPQSLTSEMEVHGNALLEFASGGINTISADGWLVVDGAAAFVADAGSIDSNSALTGLTSDAGVLEIENGACLQASLTNITGQLYLDNDATLQTNGDLDNAYILRLDEGYNEAGSTLTVNGTLTNNSLLAVGSGSGNQGTSTAVIAEDLVNSGAITLSGGTDGNTYQAALDVAGQVTDTGAISFSGDAVLNTATLDIEAGGSVADSGNISADTLTIESGGSLSGFGVLPGLIDDGVLTASGGNLDVSGAIAGSGQLTIGTSGTLELGGAASQIVSLTTSNGTLKLDVPSRFSGEITELTAGDTIDLTGLTATNAAIIGSSLVITTAGGQTFTYQISGTLVGTSFQIQSDGNGGSDLVLTSQTSQIQPYDNFYTAVDALATDISDNAPSDQITTDAVNVYTAAIAGAVGTIGNAAWQQAYTASSIAAATVGNDLADGQTGSNLLADTLGLYNTIIAGAAGSIAGGVSQTNYVSISQAAGILSTDILSGASNSQLQGDLANLYSALTSATPNAADPSGWQVAQNASNQALATLSNDIGSGAGTSQILSDISGLYNTILSGSLGAIGGTSLQAAYAGGAQTLAGLGGDIVNGASAGNLQGDVEGTYNSIVSSVSSATAASAVENYGSVTAAAETLLSQLGTTGTSILYTNASSLFSAVVSAQPLTLSVLEEIVAATGSSILNINSIEASLQPPSIDSTDWNLIADRLSAQLGDTTQSLLTALSQAAATLAQIGEPTTNVATLLDYELEQASGTLPNITLADTTDLSSAGSGLELSLTRTYSASLLDRNDAGPFGDGWTFTYDIDAVTDASGNVYVTSPSGTEVFTLQTGGTYTAQPGDASTLTVVDGAYVLTNIDGTVEDFLPNGQISSITDSNGDTINISYGSNGAISGVTSSNGQSLTFTTNAQGRITSATNQNGQEITYTYDASGDHLISVSGPDGVTSYSYDSSGNPLSQNALTQITNPDGTTETFQYDSQGNLTSQSGSNGADEVTYSYPSIGTVTETDASGNTDTLVFGVDGNLAESIDPLGNVTQYEYDSTGELTGVVTPTGGTTAYNYDADGNLTGYTDADGGTVSATYVPGTDLLASLTDQDGNTTTYNYNSAGDLTGVTYDNGDGTSYQYSANGLLTSSIDALGQTTTYTYNAQGLLTQESFSDGTFQAYAYNSQGELVSAEATNGGVTTYGYNAEGELTSVTNPSGQVESYTYNSAGQELTRTEPDGSVTQYIYNATGQLAEIQDGSGDLITQYSYNADGQLAGSLDGNGQTTSYQYDSDGNVTQILTEAADGSVTSDLTYTYNSDGLPITATSSDGTWTYTYDADGQLINAVFASTNSSIPDQNLTYEYDAAGDRTETIFNGAVNNYATNGLNQYTASDGTTYDYDADGNLVSVTQNGATTTYTYNSQNELTAVNGPSGNYTYQYDALGNLVSSTDNGVVSNYIVDPLAIYTSATGPLSAIAQAYDTAGEVTATYDYGDGLAAEITSGGTYYYNTDAIGDVVSLSGADGALVDTYDYTPFGTLLASSGDVANPFQFAGGLGAITSSDGLVEMGARYYDPAIGRFITRDPIGIVGGPDLYEYALNDPVALIDPTGLDPSPLVWESPILDSQGSPYQGSVSANSYQGQPLQGRVEVDAPQDMPPSDSNIGDPSTDLAKAFYDLELDILGDGLYEEVGAGIGGFLGGVLGFGIGLPLGPEAAIPLAIEAGEVGAEAGFYLGSLYSKLGTLLHALDFIEKSTDLLNSPPEFTNESVSALETFAAAEGEGDVHLETYDGLLYNFQAAGEFVLTQSTLPGDSFQVQVRLQPWGSNSGTYGSVSVITQVAAALGSDRVTIGLDRADPVWVDGSPVTFSATDPTITLGAGTITQLSPSTWQINWNTGEAIQVTDFEGTFINVSVALGPNDVPGSLEGLLGPDEGQSNDFQLANGTVLQQPLTTAEVYGEFANAWRVTQAISLLDYSPGETTATFTDLGFPGNPVSLSDLPSNLVAEAEQLLAQLNDPTNAPSDPIDSGLEQAAILDYLATDDQSFLTSALNLNQQGVTTTQADITPSTSPPTEVGIAAVQPAATLAGTGSTPVTFDVYLTNAETSDATFNYAVVAPGGGYLNAGAFGGTLPSGSVTIAAGSTITQFTIDIPAGSLGTDPSDVLEIGISAPNEEAIFAPTAQTTIVNDTAEPGPPPVPMLVLLTNVGTLTQTGTAYTLALGNVIQGEPLPQIDFSILNAATEPADSLSVAIGTPTGIGFNVSGDDEPAPIAAGAAYDGLSFGVDTGIYGENSETVTITPTDVNSSGYSASLPAFTLTLTDTVGAPAQATLNSSTSIIFPDVRVGTSEAETVNVSNSASGPAASLDISLSSNGAATAAGSVSLLAAGATDDTHLSVGINTGTAGPQSGVATLNFSSDNGDGNTAPLPSQEIEVSGTVFREAVPSVTPVIFHVGDASSETLTISNGATNDGYSENLVANLVGTLGSVGATGSPGEIAPQGTSTAIVLTLPTDQAGTVGAVTLDFQSDGTGIDGFGPTDLGQQQIPVVIDNYATAAFEDISGVGTFTAVGTGYTLNLGTIVQGTSIGTLDVGVVNDALGPADDLSGSFETSASSAFTLGGFGAFSSLAVGESDTDLSITLDTGSTGSFSETVTLTPTGSNASGFSTALPDETLTVEADVVMCFLAGTQIATPTGDIPVERLKIGDTVLTLRGGARPITWIGEGRVLATRGRRTAATPVIVRKGALADNVPYRDLRVTKGHSLYLDGVLIPVEFLVNHRSILWDDHAQEVHLYHIELASHDVLLANGGPAESYRDDGNRWLFRNANSGWGLPPLNPYAPVVTGGAVVDAVWRRLLDCAGARPGVPLTNDPDLHLMVDGQRLGTAQRHGDRYLFRLCRRPETVRIVSRTGAPQELGLARDPRSLGVALRQIMLTQGKRVRVLDSDDALLGDGFHSYEADNGFRWTDGDAAIPTDMFSGFTGPIELTLHIGGTNQYLADDGERRAA